MTLIEMTIVIPTYNRVQGLKVCLESIGMQDYPRDKFEVVVVDDSPAKESVALVEAMRPQSGFALISLTQDHRGPAAARNAGIRQSRGELIGFIDDDCVMEQGWIKSMVDAHRHNPAVVAVGGVTVSAKETPPLLVSQFLANGAIEVGIEGKRQIIFFPTCNVSFKREVFAAFGFDETFPYPGGEDLDFFWRLFKQGYVFLQEKNARVIHYRREGMVYFTKQAYIYGRGNLLVQHLHGDHPLLKELKTDRASFWPAALKNCIKIPRFSWIVGSRLVAEARMQGALRKLAVYGWLIVHKIFYIAGNIAEFIRIGRARIPREPAGRDAPGAPEFIILDLTHRCNLNCNICDIRKDAPASEFTTDEVTGLIAQAQAWGVPEFVLSGGEPFIRDDIPQILEYVRRNAYRIGILTNGIVLSGEFMQKITPYLVSGSLSLSVSLDALTPALHDEIRGMQGAFERTYKGLEQLSQLKRDYPAVNFNTISIVLNQNLEELLPLAQRFKSLGVNSIQFQPFLANNLVMKERSEASKYWIPPERLPALDRAIDGLLGFKNDNPSLVRNSERNLLLMKRYFRSALSPEDVRCQAAVKTMLIANNGDVTTCFDCYGNVRAASLRSIYHADAARRAAARARACRKPCLLPCFCDLT
ncbi:MAG: glycosyltransferase [Candidatus Omnitrophica bacterium]|nr:glycosyltransferase [Candidatus Omnitrophota bacterium]